MNSRPSAPRLYDRQRAKFEETFELDCSFEVAGQDRVATEPARGLASAAAP